MRRLLCTLPVGLMLFVVATPRAVRAQTATLDEGTFRLLVQGREVGSETFVISRNGNGPDAAVTLRGRVTLESDSGGDVRSSVQLAGASLRPASYQIEVGGRGGDRLSGQVTGRRVSARIVSNAGENMREYLVSEGAVVIDDAVAHQYFVLAMRAHAGEVHIPVILPRAGKQAFVDVTVQPNVAITVAGQPVQARKLVITEPGGETRNVWTDSDDRILRLEIPARNYVAERTTLPR